MKNFFTHLKFLFSIYLLGLILSFLIRLFLLFSQWDQVAILPKSALLLSKAFFMGFRFDTVISGYILFFPLIIILLLSIIGVETKGIVRFSHIIFCICYSLCLITCVANIPYFGEFFKHINASIFSWKDDTGFVFSMIKSDSRYFLFLLLALAFAAVFCVVSSLLFKKLYKNFTPAIRFHFSLKITGLKFLCFLIVGGLCFLGIRGRIEKKSPIRVGTAYFCNYAFPNQLGLNPVFYFINTIIDSQEDSKQKVQLMPDEEAIAWVRHFYSITDSLASPIAHSITPQGERKNYNVVVVIMEGMSAEFMKRHGNPDSKTPFLDSLSAQSIYFENYYTAGVHTMNGIYSTLFSFPALFIQHPLKSATILHYQGLPYELKKNGYQTAYFTTHDDQFDNVGGFLSANDIEFIMAQKDYPANRVVSTLGVPDDYMFERAIGELNRLAANNCPFFAAMMTASNHGPIVVPNYFKAKSKDEREQILEYSDWALREFFNRAKKEKWFDNTIFIFTADHGATIGKQPYEISLSRQHSPLIIFQKGRLPELKTGVASQLDIFPTVMGLLNISYTNTTFGIDLLSQNRQYAVLNSDNVIACINDSLMYVYNAESHIEGLYRYKQQETQNLLHAKNGQANEMKNYMFATMQAAQYIINNNLTSIKE